VPGVAHPEVQPGAARWRISTARFFSWIVLCLNVRLHEMGLIP
jgi:hypothetical protein